MDGDGDAGEGAMDAYEVLGVPETAGKREIRTAYRKRALAVHPDRNRGDEGAAAMFIRVNRAYETLADDERRKELDGRRAAAKALARRRAEEGAKARAMREALERRERAAEAERTGHTEAQRVAEAKRGTEEAIRRLVEEGVLRPPGAAAAQQQQQREQQQQQQQQPPPQQQPQQQSINAVFVHWPEGSAAAGLSEDVLKRIFGVYGDVARVAADPTRHRALLEFRSESAALEALDHEGVSLTVSLATHADVEQLFAPGAGASSHRAAGGGSGARGGGAGAAAEDTELEDMERHVLSRLRGASSFPKRE